MEADLSTVVEVNLLSVEPRGDFIDVQRELVLEDGSVLRGKHSFPADTLEWRAAEYGIDPADLDTLLDIVIHEPFLGEPDRPELALYDAATIEEARDYHLARIGALKAKSNKPRQAGPPDQVRERIKVLAIMNPEAVSLKRELVGKGREKFQQAKEESAKAGLRALFVEPLDTEEARLNRLRASLRAQRPTIQQEKKNGSH